MTSSGTRILLVALSTMCLVAAAGCKKPHDHGSGHGHDHAKEHDHETIPGHEHEADQAHHQDHASAAAHEHEHDEDHANAEKHEHEDAEEHGHDHGSADHEGHDHHQAHDAQEDVCVHLDAEIFRDLDVRTAKIEPRPHFPAVKIPGVIREDPDRRMDICAPLTARLLRLQAPPKSTVGAGQRLAVLEVLDPEVRQLQIRAVEARAELLVARTERDRTRRYLEALGSRGESVAEEKRRVEADLEILEAKVRAQGDSLKAVLMSLEVAGLSSAQIQALEKKGETVSRIALFSPRLPGRPDLEVAARPVHLGQTVKAGDKLFELVALDKLRVVGEAFEADLPTVRKAARENLPVSLIIPARKDAVEGLTILSVESTMESDERLTHFFVWLPNRKISEKREGAGRYVDWDFRVGTRVQILVASRGSTLRFVLPVGALVREGGRVFVFRTHGRGCDRVPVKIESLDDRNAIVSLDTGLEAGDELIIQGALQVHLALEKSLRGSTAGSDHGHQH